MPGLPAQLLKKLTQTLLTCGPFDMHQTVVAVFKNDERLAPWRHQIPQAIDSRQLVNLFIGDFLDRRNKAGQSVLVLFLQALHDQEIEEDECHLHLNDLAIEVAAVLGSALPPLAGSNLWRAAAARTGESLPDALGGYGPMLNEPEPYRQQVVLPPGLPEGAFAARLESLKKKEKADWLPVSFLEKGLQAVRAVGRVEHQGRKIGTAFLVAPDLVLTNFHVIREVPLLEEGGVRFNVGSPGKTQWSYFAVLMAHSAIEELDFALVRLATSVGSSYVALSAETAYPAQSANILQYPKGESMQVALRFNEVVHVDPTRLYYVTDTDEGSSGSPVFDDDWRVIALHRAGVVDNAQQPVKHANQGVPLTAIEPLIRPYLSGG